MKNITREQYLEALDIVETYHRQLRQSNDETERDDLHWDHLKAGDYIVFDRSRVSSVTIGKRYKVLAVKAWKLPYASFGFIDDSGKRKNLAKYAQGYSMRIVSVTPQ